MNTHPAPINNVSSYRPSTAADGMRTIPMTWIWGTVFVTVVLVLRILDPIQAVEYLIENQGLGEEGSTVVGVITGYTFPLTLGFTIIMFYLLSGRRLANDSRINLLAAAGVLWVSGFLANAFGFGLSPSYTQFPSGPFWLAFPLYVAAGYLSSYGFPLSLCAFTIGTALALQIERWLYRLTRG